MYLKNNLRDLLLAIIVSTLGFCAALLLVRFLPGGAIREEAASRDNLPKSASKDKDVPRQSPGPATSEPSPRAAAHPAPISPWLFVGDAFEGTLLQLTNEHRKWTRSQWRDEFENLRQIGMKIVVLQWSQYDDADFTQADGRKSPVEEIAAVADEEGMNLYVGLSLRKSWGHPESFTKKYIAEELERNTLLADRLHAMLKPHSSFSGWYIPQEVCDHGDTASHQAMMAEFFHNLTKHLHELDSLKPVCASGFVDSAKTDLVHFVWYWTLFLNESGIDVLLFQDGAGLSRRSKWQDNLPFIEAIISLSKEFDCEIWLVAETFVQTHGQPIDDKPFAAKPADIARVRQQLEALSKFKKRLIAFSYFDYMRPSSGKEASELYDGYRQFVDETIARNSKEESPTSPPPTPSSEGR